VLAARHSSMAQSRRGSPPELGIFVAQGRQGCLGLVPREAAHDGDSTSVSQKTFARAPSVRSPRRVPSPACRSTRERSSVPLLSISSVGESVHAAVGFAAKVCSGGGSRPPGGRGSAWARRCLAAVSVRSYDQFGVLEMTISMGVLGAGQEAVPVLEGFLLREMMEISSVRSTWSPPPGHGSRR